MNHLSFTFKCLAFTLLTIVSSQDSKLTADVPATRRLLSFDSHNKRWQTSKDSAGLYFKTTQAVSGVKLLFHKSALRMQTLRIRIQSNCQVITISSGDHQLSFTSSKSGNMTIHMDAAGDQYNLEFNQAKVSDKQQAIWRQLIDSGNQQLSLELSGATWAIIHRSDIYRKPLAFHTDHLSLQTVTNPENFKPETLISKSPFAQKIQNAHILLSISSGVNEILKVPATYIASDGTAITTLHPLIHLAGKKVKKIQKDWLETSSSFRRFVDHEKRPYKVKAYIEDLDLALIQPVTPIKTYDFLPISTIATTDDLWAIPSHFAPNTIFRTTRHRHIKSSNLSIQALMTLRPKLTTERHFIAQDKQLNLLFAGGSLVDRHGRLKGILRWHPTTEITRRTLGPKLTPNNTMAIHTSHIEKLLEIAKTGLTVKAPSRLKSPHPTMKRYTYAGDKIVNSGELLASFLQVKLRSINKKSRLMPVRPLKQFRKQLDTFTHQIYHHQGDNNDPKHKRMAEEIRDWINFKPDQLIDHLRLFNGQSLKTEVNGLSEGASIVMVLSHAEHALLSNPKFNHYYFKDPDSGVRTCYLLTSPHLNIDHSGKQGKLSLVISRISSVSKLESGATFIILSGGLLIEI